MLGKLFRQEVKSQGKTITGMYGVLAAATLLIIVLFQIGKFIDQRFFGTIFMTACVFYGLSVIVVAVVNFIYLCFRFYKSMYSEQGYLTHTLPVKTTHILNVKVAVSFGYLFMTAILCLASFFIIGMAMGGISAGEIIAVIGKGIDEISKEVQVPGFAFVIFFILLAILGCLNALLMFFAGSSIGQLFQRSKGACGIAAGIGLYYVSQIASLAAVLIGVLLTETISVVPESVWYMGGACLVALIWTVVYYMICRVIVIKHLNLE